MTISGFYGTFLCTVHINRYIINFQVQRKREQNIYKELLDRFTEVLDANKTSKTIDYIGAWD